MIDRRLGQLPGLMLTLHSLRHEVHIAWYSIILEDVDLLIQSVPGELRNALTQEDIRLFF